MEEWTDLHDIKEVESIRLGDNLREENVFKMTSRLWIRIPGCVQQDVGAREGDSKIKICRNEPCLE